MHVQLSDIRDVVAVQRLSAVLHDSRIVSIAAAGDFTMTLKRPGYEHGYLLSKGCWSLGRRWMYPWVECELTIAPVVAVTHERSADVEQALDGFAAIRVSSDEQVIIGCHYSEIAVVVGPDTTLRLRDTGQTACRDEGMVVFSSEPLDLSFIRPFLEE